MFIHLIYVSLKRGKFDIRVVTQLHGSLHRDSWLSRLLFSPAWLSKNRIMAIFILINISWWLYSNILFLFPLNDIANIKI